MTTMPIGPELVDAIRAAGLTGASMTAIARDLGIARPTVTRILDEAGITRTRHDDHPTPGPFDPRPWMDDALCLQTGPDAFVLDRGGSTKAAKAVCAKCPVREPCLDYALDHRELLGVWGGLSEQERRPLRRGAAA